MSRWLLDTNVVSELRKPAPSRKVFAWLEAQRPDDLYVSVISFVEIRHGIELQTDPALREQLSLWLDHKIRPMYARRTIEIGEAELLTWRYLAVDLARQRKTVPEPDLLIAAIARHHGMAIATRNSTDFIPTGLPILNPFTGERFNGA